MNDENGANQQPQYGGQQPAADPQAQYTQPLTTEQQAQYAYAQQQAAGQQGQYAYAQQQAQYGYAQGQYGYAQQQTYTAPSKSGHHGKGGGWIAFLRVILWIWFTLLCIAGLVVCIVCFAQASSFGPYSDDAAMALMLTGIGSLLSCVLLAFVSVAGGMIALDAAANIKRTATNTAHILELLQKQDK